MTKPNTPGPLTVGTRMRCHTFGGLEATVVATHGGRAFVEATIEGGNPSFYAVNLDTMKDQDGDRWEVVPMPVYRYRNVYDDGTFGTATHATEGAARRLTKLGKTRVGILEIAYSDGQKIGSRMISTVPQLRTAIRKDGYNPYA